MKLNQLLHDEKIFIASHLKEAIKEFETHSYKEGGKKNGETDKVNDDFLDAFRYFIFSYKPPKSMSRTEQRYQRKY